jgi:hypothetical protein
MKKLLLIFAFSFLAISIFAQDPPDDWKNPFRRKVEFEDSVFFNVAPTLKAGQYINLDDVYVKLYPDTSIVTTATYTLDLADANTEIRMSSASYQEITVPANASIDFEILTKITFYHWGAGAVRINGAVGVTIEGPLDSCTMNTRKQTYQIEQTGLNKWRLMGNFSD